MKKIFSIFILALLLASSANAKMFFSGSTGISTNFDFDDSDLALKLNGYFSGQINFWNCLFFRGEFSIQTSNILNSGIFKEADSIFCLNELSATYMHPFLGITQFFSIFTGNLEPIGSGLFMQRHLGVKPYSSPVTEGYLGQNGANVYSPYGFGGSYAFKVNSAPVASAFYIYGNEKDKNKDSMDSGKEGQINFDWRLATSFRYFKFDGDIGLSAPLETKDGNNKDVLLLVDRLFLHTGVDMLIGSRYFMSMLCQFGFDSLPIKDPDEECKIGASEVYLLVEPRFVTDDFSLYLTMFSLPENRLKKLMFIEDTFGFNASLFTEKFRIRNSQLKFGFHTTVSFKDKDFEDLKRFSKLSEDVNVKVSPFFKAEIMHGMFESMVQINCSKIGDSWKEALKLNIGYKKDL